jgi:radical SAM protein with 4Fe4S-binding SPASM domain
MPGCGAGQIHDPEFSREAIEEAAKSGRLLAMDVELGPNGTSRCHHSFAPEGPNSGKELSSEELRDVVLQARDLGARKISILDGEPTRHRRILDLARFIGSQSLEAEMFTSGVGITTDFARDLFESRVGVVLRVPCCDQDVPEALAGSKGSFTLVQDAVGALREAGYSSQAALLRVEEGRFARIAAIEGDEDSRAWEADPASWGNGCMRHKFSCLVRWQGDVIPCVGLRIPIGNIREQRLRDIIKDSEVLEDLRDHTRTMKGPCASCEESDVCYGCRGAAYQATGDYLASDPFCWRNAGRQGEIIRLPIAAAEVIPQEPPMRVIDDLVRTGERSGEVSARVSEGMPFVGEDGVVDEAVYFEMMAQSIAALNGFKQLGRSTSAPEGYLVGAQKLEVLGPARVGDTLSISVYKETRFGNFGVVRGSVSREDTILARGEIKIWHQAGNISEPASSEE